MESRPGYGLKRTVNAQDVRGGAGLVVAWLSKSGNTKIFGEIYDRSKGFVNAPA